MQKKGQGGGKKQGELLEKGSVLQLGRGGRGLVGLSPPTPPHWSCLEQTSAKAATVPEETVPTLDTPASPPLRRPAAVIQDSVLMGDPPYLLSDPLYLGSASLACHSELHCLELCDRRPLMAVNGKPHGNSLRCAKCHV